ncbi:MAG: ROK family protein [Chthoniobacterales bacterium]|nr:ROK family protein [Chthoniobacterales bacterium]
MNVLGIDIGGSGIKGAPVDTGSGTLAAERLRIPTPTPSTPDAVAEVARNIIENFSSTPGPVGITFPGVVKSGRVLTAANMDPIWAGFEAATFFSAKLGRPAIVLNDADAAGLAEMRFGAGRGIRGVVILITLGTGIGSALFCEGRLVPNTELGHMEIRGKDAEARASERVREEKDLGWPEWGERVGEVVAKIAFLFNPDLFIIGGGVSRKAEKFLPVVQGMVKVPVVPAQLQNQAGLVGAALVAGESASPA